MLRSRAAYLLIGMAMLVAGAAIMSTIASAEEVEAPFWKVAEKRLEAEQKQQAKVRQRKTSSEEETVITGELPIEKGTKKVSIELRCKAAVSKNAELKGSKPHSDAFFNVGLAIGGCTLWAKNGKELVEEKGCKVEATPGEELLGRFWLEGTTLEGKNVPVLLLKAAKIATLKVTGEGCRFAGEYTLGGSIALQVSPENAEGKALRFILPSPPITAVHQAQPEKEEAAPQLKLNGVQASLTGEFETTLESGGKFGVFAPEGEAPFWKVNEKRLEAEEKAPAKVAARQAKKTAKETIIKGELPITKTEKQGEVEIRCTTAISKNATLTGSKPHADSFFNLGLALTGCRLWAKNGTELVEEKECAVEATAGEELLGRFWLEGTALEGKTAVVLLLKATKITTLKVTGAGCRFVGEYTLGGSVAVQVSPENTEGKAVRLIFPTPSVKNVHQAQPAEEKFEPELKLGSSKATITSELESELESGLPFGAFE